jgi:type I restriction enzyme M protein
MSSPSETETVVKRILPYLRRRGYDETADFQFEAGATYDDRYAKGYIDILVTCGQAHPRFLVEAKRISRAITKADEKQALDYGRAEKVPFVVVTNGRDVRALNTNTGDPIHWDGTRVGRIPTKAQLPTAVDFLRRNKDAQAVPLGGDASLPFRPGLPLRQLNRLFAKCHTWIRNIEKREDDSFADFSKILFLKLLEEKADAEGRKLPYTYRFWELAEAEDAKADQVRAAVQSMIADARKQYGDVLADPLKLNQAATYLKIVRALAEVSFLDSEADVKGAAFEYFVRATLKGKKLGQYFTPRPLVDFMITLIGRERVMTALNAGMPIRVVDPVCGTGGFLVYMMRAALAEIDAAFAARRITAATRDGLIRQVMQDVFFGADANEGVASAAKMNMVIAGDGHANIAAEDTLTKNAKVWSPPDGIDLIVTNPPFGTSESDSLDAEDLGAYEIGTTRGQLLFLQRMLSAIKPEGFICTVIDEGVLNTETAQGVRRAILEQSYLRAVVRLPPETFRPNKINVRTAVLLMERRMATDPDLLDRYPVRFIDVESLGYDGTGASVRGFDFSRLTRELERWMTTAAPKARTGYGWSSFTVPSRDIARDVTCRFDYKYWGPRVRKRLAAANRRGAVTLKQLNLVATQRGKSPSADVYVDPADGFARILKAGSSITAYGEIAPIGESDFIEKDEYDMLPAACKVRRWDILIASTGTGTLGKAAVYDSSSPAVADGHITIVRVDRKHVVPRYLADYLRAGFGRDQIERLYTGSTGLIELAPQQVDAIVVELPSRAKQKSASDKLRRAEQGARKSTHAAANKLAAARAAFAGPA